MGKNTQNDQNRSLLDTQRTNAGKDYSGFNTNANEDYQNARINSTRIGTGIEDRYSNPNSFLPSGALPNSSGWFNNPTGPSIGGSASFDPNGDFASARTGYQKFADTGGAGNYDEAKSLYKNIASTGGFNADALRNRATAQIPAFYQAYKDSAQRRSNVQGGYSPGFDAQQAELGRQQGREGFNASRQVEGDIADKTQQGAEFGASGLAGIARDISGNQLTGLGGLTNIGQAGMANSQYNAGLNQQNNQFNQSQSQAFQDAMARLYTQNNQNAAAGLQGYYSSSPGDRDSSRAAILSGIGGLHGNQLGNLGIRSGIQNKTTNWSGILGALAGAGNGFGNRNSTGQNGLVNGNYADPSWSGYPTSGDDPYGFGPTPTGVGGLPPGGVPGTTVPLPSADYRFQ